jgi:hypothetical protein
VTCEAWLTEDMAKSDAGELTCSDVTGTPRAVLAEQLSLVHPVPTILSVFT